MSIVPITMCGDKILRKKTAKFTDIDDSTIDTIADMFETMRNAGGIGLAANQIGLNKQIFVVDGSFAGLGLIGSVNIKVEVENGYAVKITGGNAAKKLNTILDEVGKDARNIAEFGIGTNDSAKLSGIILEDEKVMGTVHIALGNNVTMGGIVNVPIHVDGVIKQPTVWMDDKLLIKDGKLLVA